MSADDLFEEAEKRRLGVRPWTATKPPAQDRKEKFQACRDTAIQTLSDAIINADQDVSWKIRKVQDAIDNIVAMHKHRSYDEVEESKRRLVNTGLMGSMREHLPNMVSKLIDHHKDLRKRYDHREKVLKRMSEQLKSAGIEPDTTKLDPWDEGAAADPTQVKP